MAAETAVFAVRSAKPCFSWASCLYGHHTELAYSKCLVIGWGVAGGFFGYNFPNLNGSGRNLECERAGSALTQKTGRNRPIGVPPNVAFSLRLSTGNVAIVGRSENAT